MKNYIVMAWLSEPGNDFEPGWEQFKYASDDFQDAMDHAADQLAIYDEASVIDLRSLKEMIFLKGSGRTPELSWK